MPWERTAIVDGKKWCPGCERMREIACFHRASRQTTGLQGRCKECRAKSDRLKPEADRFWARVNKNGPVPAHRPELGACWIWTRAKNDRGYGRFAHDGVGMYAHRRAYELAIGPLGDGLLACHKCDNPPCVNPAHLFPGTHLDNAGDMLAKGRHRVVVRKGELAGTAKLTAAQVEAIRAALSGGETGVSLAGRFGVSASTISGIRVGRIWRESA